MVNGLLLGRFLLIKERRLSPSDSGDLKRRKIMGSKGRKNVKKPKKSKQEKQAAKKK
jgi:hypothetical protein